MSPATPLRKIAIVGMGAIGSVFGSWLGSRLAPGLIQLSALARGETLRQLQTTGLTRVDADGTSVLTPIHASDDAAALGPQDLIVIAVKAPSLVHIAASIGPLIAPHTIVLVAMNGVPWWFFDGLQGELSGTRLLSVDPDGTLTAAIPTLQVMGCVVHVSAAAPRPAHVERIKNNQLIIGEPLGAMTQRLHDVAGLLTDAGFAVKPTDSIQKEIWYKLWGNMTMNPVSALTLAPCDRILDDPLVRAFCSAVMEEAKIIGNRIGCPIAQVPEDRHAITRSLGSFKTSMLQDVEAGRPVELDALVSSVREMGQLLGLATPNMDALLGLTRLMARSKGIYPQ